MSPRMLKVYKALKKEGFPESEIVNLMVESLVIIERATE